jgi:hypothetical protein
MKMAYFNVEFLVVHTTKIHKYMKEHFFYIKDICSQRHTIWRFENI